MKFNFLYKFISNNRLLFCLLFFISLFIFCTKKSKAQPKFNQGKATENTPSKFAQKDTSSLSRKHEHFDSRVTIFYTQFYDNQKKYLDTTIRNYHRDRYLNIWQQDLGNTGTAVYTIKANLNFSATPSLINTNIYEPYLFKVDSAKFFNTSNPYSEFWYKAGTMKEQSGELLHTQNINPNNNFSFRYAKYSSPGFFRNQCSNHDHFLATYQFTPKNSKRFSSKAIFVVNQIVQDENGGVVTDTVLPYADYSVRTTVPVLFSNVGISNNRSNINNYFRQNELRIESKFALGFKKSKDTIAKKSNFELVHTLRINGEKHQLKDLEPEQQFFNYWVDTAFYSKDTIIASHRLQTIQNEFGGQLPNIAKGKILLNASIGFEIQTYTKKGGATTFFNNYVKGNVQSNNENLKWQYNANAQFYFAGFAAGNYNLNAIASRKIKNLNMQVHFNQCISNAPFEMFDYQSNFYSWKNNFNKIFNTAVGASIENSIKHYKLSANNTSCINYVYWDTNYIAKQFNANLNLLQIEAQKNIYFGKWNALINLLLQQKNNNAPINLPPFASRLQVAYTNKIFKKSMLASIGLDAAYNSPFVSAQYLPFVNQYSFGQSYTQNNVPRVAVFFNSKIKRFRVYISADELLQPLNYSKNRILVQGYPAQDLIFRAGFSWVMVN